jgi:methyltransferase (TIGR00027 family)
MKKGTASRTARSVAARRLQYPRPAAPYGDPGADEALTRDVAAGLSPSPGRMHEYLRARTAFFDRVTLDALADGITQVVTGGAGYDGRALRYARPGVRWFEVDHPATQRDKLERLSRLSLATGHIRFVPADFTADPVARPLLEAGLDPARRALFLFEGVAVYLGEADTQRVLAEFRQVTVDGSLLALSVSTGSASSETRARFQQRVAELGEPARTVLTADATRDLLLPVGWQIADADADAGARQRSAGLLRAQAVAPDPERPAPNPQRPAADPAERGRAAAPRRGLPASALPRSQPRPEPGSAPEAPGPERLPLSALLSQALVAFTIEADNEAEHRLPHRTTRQGKTGGQPGGVWLTSLLMWANCLRHLPDAGLTLAELRDRARTGTNLDGMRRWGYVTLTPDLARGRRPDAGTVIRPTDRGRTARDTWPGAIAEVESRWRDRLGGAAYTRLQGALAGVTGQLDPALPDCLPVLGYGLYSRPHPAIPASPASPASRTSGAGPLPAAPPAPAASLPLWALLSRPLLAFALQYERDPGPSLAVSADVLRVLTGTGVLVKDIPALGGVSRESVAMALGSLRESGLAAEGPDPAGSRFRAAQLTSRGSAARGRYQRRTADIEADWAARFGGGTVSVLRQALEPLAAGDPPPLLAGLGPYPDGWRARVRPLGALPHYPMTLHRGGYPDGS